MRGSHPNRKSPPLLDRVTSLLGKKVNSLTVVRYAEKGGKDVGNLWWCKCDCGKEVKVRSSHLTTGRRKTCGCYRNLKFTPGQKFSLLTVISQEPSKTNRGIYWKCLCDCGNECLKTATFLQKGRVKSCGCLASNPPGKSARARVYRTYRYGAKRRKITFDLTEEEALTLLAGNCHYCGIEPLRVLSEGPGQFIYNGIDRIDSRLGYQSGNVLSCCTACNMAKRVMSYDEFLTWIDRVASHLHSTLADRRSETSLSTDSFKDCSAHSRPMCPHTES